MQGWTLDPDTSSSIAVHAYGGTGEAKAGNPAAAASATIRRDDVAAAWTGLGANHGFDFGFVVGSGQHRFCAYGINAPGTPGYNRRFDCLDMAVSSEPFGNFEEVRRVPGGVVLSGWVLDPDVSSSTEVHLYGGTGEAVASNPAIAVRADQARPDVGQAHVGYGDDHGFSAMMLLGPGQHNICAYAINASGTPGNHQRLQCRVVNVSSEPMGNVEFFQPVSGGVRASGWALDPDVRTSIEIHVYGGNGEGNPAVNPAMAMIADVPRPDVDEAFPDYRSVQSGIGHGFSGILSLPSGRHTVCAYAINAGGTPGSHQRLRCQTMTV